MVSGNRLIFSGARLVKNLSSTALLKLSMLGVRNSIRQAIPSVTSNISKNLSKIFIKDNVFFIKYVIVFLDPGAELIYLMGKQSVGLLRKKFIDQGKIISKIVPGLEGYLETLEKKLADKLPDRVVFDSDNGKFFLDSGGEISLVKNGEAYNNQAIYVEIDIKNNQWLVDKKYICQNTVGNKKCSKIPHFNANSNLDKVKINLHDIHFEDNADFYLIELIKANMNMDTIYKIFIKNNTENYTEIVKEVKKATSSMENIAFETRCVVTWGGFTTKNFESIFIVKVKNSNKYYIIDLPNKIIETERNWKFKFVDINKEKNVFIQYFDFNSEEEKEIRKTLDDYPAAPLLNAITLIEPDWYYNDLQKINFPRENILYNKKLIINNNELRNDLQMMSKYGLDINKTLSLNSHWFLEKINLQTQPYSDDHHFGSRISLSFYLNCASQSGPFVEIPKLIWNEQITTHSASEGHRIVSTNRYESDHKSTTFFPWENKYYLAYHCVMEKQNKEEAIFVKLMDTIGNPVNSNEFTEVETLEEKSQQVIDYLKINGGKLKITIVDLPRIKLKNEFYERKIDFSVGFLNNNELATFTQGIIENSNAEKIAFVTTSKTVLVAEKL